MNKKGNSPLNKKKIRHKYEVDEILELIGLINPNNNKPYNVTNEYQRKQKKINLKKKI